MSTSSTNISINSEFIKLARSLRDAQKEAPHSQRSQRRARSLEQMFDTRLEAIERELARVQQFSETAPVRDRLL